MVRICLTLNLVLVLFSVSCTAQVESEVFEYRKTLKGFVFPDTLIKSHDYKIVKVYGNDCDLIGDSCNNFDSIPLLISKMENLEELYFIMHHIREVPSFLGDLRKLRILDLSNNRNLKQFESLCVLDNLEVLNLNDCNLDSFPKCLLSLNKLKALGLEGNYFSEDTKSKIRARLPNTKVYF